MTATTVYCRVCRRPNPLAATLRVTDRSGEVPPFHVCRPSEQGCFAQIVGPATRWAIEPGAPLECTPSRPCDGCTRREAERAARYAPRQHDPAPFGGWGSA